VTLFCEATGFWAASPIIVTGCGASVSLWAAGTRGLTGSSWSCPHLADLQLLSSV
jgi:hypothetical protein